MLHRFYPHEPDLNHAEPAVQDEVFKIMSAWLAVGVDGFRIDAAPTWPRRTPRVTKSPAPMTT